MLYMPRHNEPAPNVTANDPSAVFVVKSLLYPLATVISLCTCVLWWREYPHGPYFLLGVLAFISVAEFLDVAPLEASHSFSWALRLLVDISLRGSLIVTRRSVVLSWALLTDTHLMFGHTTLIHVSHNHEEKLWRAMARDSRASPVSKLILWQNYRKVRVLERRIVRAVDLLTTITDEDRASLGRELDEKHTLTLTPGYDGWATRERRIGPNTPRRVILMGSYRWVVKRENLARFLQLADPIFFRNGIELDVVGDGPEKLVATLRRRCRATCFHGFVKDVAGLFADARIAVVPEAIGGGFKLKFLDYFFGRVPVATLSHATAGLPQELREQTLSCDSLPALVEVIVSNIDRLDDLNSMQERAFIHCSARFTWHERAVNLRKAIVSSQHG